jgi:uncharacterized spore protein YtfJ
VLFGGGGGGGIEVVPVSFIIIKGDKVDVLPAGGTATVPPSKIVSTIERLVDILPGVVEKLENFVEKQKEKKEAKEKESQNEIDVTKF